MMKKISPVLLLSQWLEKIIRPGFMNFSLTVVLYPISTLVLVQNISPEIAVLSKEELIISSLEGKELYYLHWCNKSILSY